MSEFPELMASLAPLDNEVPLDAKVLMDPLDHQDPLDPLSAFPDLLEEVVLTEQQDLKD